jgi:hypothetical protein
MAAGFWLAIGRCVFEIVTSPAANTAAGDGGGIGGVVGGGPGHLCGVQKGRAGGQVRGHHSGGEFGRRVGRSDAGCGGERGCDLAGYRLRYVRLASDIEKGRFIVENRMAREIRVMELPEEYAAIETNRAPVWLYTFWIETPGGNTYWRYTSYADNLTSNGNVFTSFPGGLSTAKSNAR